MIFLFFFVSWVVFLRILFKSGDSFFVSPIIFILIPSETTWSIWYTNQVNDSFSVSIGALYQDDQLINHDSDTTDADPVAARLDDFTRVDMAMAFTPSASDTVRLNIENLTDETYYPHSHSTHQATVGEPINVRLSYQKTF